MRNLRRLELVVFPRSVQILSLAVIVERARAFERFVDEIVRITGHMVYKYLRAAEPVLHL